MKTLVIFTGGTIASVQKEGVRILENGKLTSKGAKKRPEDFLLLKSYADALCLGNDALEAMFDVLEPMSILSENSGLDFLNTFIACLMGIDATKYKGIVITHGTDTLGYTACLTGLLFSHLRIPIIFIADNFPLAHKESCGVDNLSKAIDIINNTSLIGTYSVFKNFDGKTEVNLATRLSQSQAFINEFHSAHSIPYLYYEHNKRYEFLDITNPSVDDIRSRVQMPIFGTNQDVRLTNGIMYLKLFPSFSFDWIDYKNLKAIVVEGYHSFTAAETTSEADRLCPQKECTISYGAELAHKHGVRLYFTPFRSGVKYPSTSSIIENKLIKTIDDTSPITAYCKVLIAHSLFNEEKEIDDFLDKDIFFEKLVPYKKA